LWIQTSVIPSLADEKTVVDRIPEHIRARGWLRTGEPLRQAQQEIRNAMIKMASTRTLLARRPWRGGDSRGCGRGASVPDNDASELRMALTARHQLAEEQIFIADGRWAFWMWWHAPCLCRGPTASAANRSFISYPLITKSIGARFIEVPLRDDAYDLDAIAEAIDEQTRVVILANPNNPTDDV